MWTQGPANTIDDVGGLSVGHAHDFESRTGTSVLVFDAPATASVSILGQAPGTRESALLDPARSVQEVDAMVLSGGSAFGLSAADAVMGALRKAGRGFKVADALVPIVPAAILFDLANGGTKPDNLSELYQSLGRQAFGNLDQAEHLGAVGAGFGATTGAGPGALGSASAVFTERAPPPLQGRTIAALVAVNAVGSPFFDDGEHFRAAAFEIDGEFGGRGFPPAAHLPSHALTMKGSPAAATNTTIGCLVTDLPLSKTGCHGLALAGQDGIANAIFPAHTTLDGDLVFAASVGLGDPLQDIGTMAVVQAAGTACMARAIARGIHALDR